MTASLLLADDDDLDRSASLLVRFQERAQVRAIVHLLLLDVVHLRNNLHRRVVIPNFLHNHTETLFCSCVVSGP